MCEWTLPSEKSPMKWTVPPPPFTLPTSRFQVAPSNMAPVAMELETSLAPWE